MRLSYAGTVDRRYRGERGPRYVLSEWNFSAWSVHPEHQAAVAELSEARCALSVEPFNLDRIMPDEELRELLTEAPDAARAGGVLIWASNPLLSEVVIDVLIGTETECPLELEESLQSQHLGIGLDFEPGFSLVENNRFMKRPVTYSQFKAVRKIFLGQFPEFALIRRHVP